MVIEFNLNEQQAQQALEHGRKVQHRYWQEEEYIYKKDGQIYDEKNRKKSNFILSNYSIERYSNKWGIKPD